MINRAISYHSWTGLRRPDIAGSIASMDGPYPPTLASSLTVWWTFYIERVERQPSPEATSKSHVSGKLEPMTPAKFERLVRQAMEQIPAEIQRRLENVDVVVEEWPTSDQLVGTGLDEGDQLLGLYEGIPLTDRYGYNMVLPDKITLFQGSIEEVCSNDQEVIEEIRDTVVHEVAHHFGIDDDRLEEMGI